MNRHYNPPRKVIVASCIQDFRTCPPGLDARIALAQTCIDNMQAAAAESYPGRDIDLVCLPEHIIANGGKDLSLDERTVALEGKVLESFAARAKADNFNLVLPIHLAADRKAGKYYNSAAVINRDGELVGVYNKLHPVVQVDCSVPESGITPGELDVPVFDLDFGRIGVQICFDISYADGWQQLSEKGAEIVVWPTASPATFPPRAYAERFGYYVVSSPFRDNAGVYEPTGLIASQITPPQNTLVTEIDLSWAILHWSPRLAGGKAFEDRYGTAASCHYEHSEDVGLFWSNDPQISIGKMIDELGFEERQQWLDRNSKIVDAARDGQ